MQPAKRHMHIRKTYLKRFWEQFLNTSPLPQLDRWLAETLKSYKTFGKQDRACYAQYLFAMVRFGGACIPESLWTSTTVTPLEAWRDIPFEDLFQAADLYIRHPEHGPFLRWLPHGTEPYLKRRAVQSGWDLNTLESFIKAHASKPPLWLRLNAAEHRRRVEEDLTLHGFSILDSPTPECLSVQGKRSLFGLETFTEQGLFEIQDAASQDILSSLPLSPHAYVWDACAGGGGKTMQLAARLKGKGSILASDVRDWKFKDIRTRGQRAGFHNIHCKSHDATMAFPPGWRPTSTKTAAHTGFEAVVIDAPCSSSGTWRRNPDAKLRWDPAGLKLLRELQVRILSQTAREVRLGGYLLYGTCSWLVEENEDVIQTFLDSCSGRFTLVQSQLYGNPHKDADTTFGALLQRCL